MMSVHAQGLHVKAAELLLLLLLLLLLPVTLSQISRPPNPFPLY